MEDRTTRKITEKTMEELEILAKLTLTEEEKNASVEEMQNMLDYVDQLNRLDTEGVEPLFHVFPLLNVFREDAEEDGCTREELLFNAPNEKDGQILVPKTIG